MTKSSSSSSFSPDDRTPRRKALPRDNKKTERPPTRRQRAKELGTTPYELKKASVERFEATRMPAIVYEDEQILVISKPGGVAAQAQPGLTVHEDYQTMLDKLVQRTDSPVLKPVHRLDKVPFLKVLSPILGMLTHLVREGDYWMSRVRKD